MSVQAVNDFIKKVQQDAGFHSQFISFLLERKDRRFEPSWIVEFAAARGMAFSLEDCDRAILEKVSSGEITPKEWEILRSGKLAAPGFLNIF